MGLMYLAISPSPQPPPAALRIPLTARRFAGGGARARRGRGLATDLLHRLTQGQWGRIQGGVESTVPSDGMRVG